jgi:hypothetical protein
MKSLSAAAKLDARYLLAGRRQIRWKFSLYSLNAADGHDAVASAARSSCSRSMRSTVAGEGCRPFFLSVAMARRPAMSRRLSFYSRRCSAMASIASSRLADVELADLVSQECAFDHG